MRDYNTVEGIVESSNVNGKTVISQSYCTYPLKFIVIHKDARIATQGQDTIPTRVHPAWVYEVNYGGGLVSGDDVSINMQVGGDSTVVLTGQSSMKIYKHKGEGRATAHRVHATVESGGLLCSAFPPVTCFAGAEYSQTQCVRLADADANVVMVEWCTAGRIALGECWDFECFTNLNEVWIGDKLLVREAVRLSNRDGPPTVKERMHNYTNTATVILVGPRVMTYAQRALKDIGSMQVSGNARRNQITGRPALVCSASPLKVKVAENAKEEVVVGVIVKVASETTNQTLEFVSELLGQAWVDLLGADPYK